MIVLNGIDEIRAAQGTQLGTSPWRTMSQELIDGFAELTGDDQWIHVDAARAADGPFGTTIAHGLLTLALVPSLGREIFRITGTTMVVNYGLNKVRFISPVLRGMALRMTSTLKTVDDVGSDAVQLTFEHTVELQDEPKPACGCVTLSRCYF